MRGSTTLAAATLLLLPVLAGGAWAADPDPATWDQFTLQGPPVAVGFLASGPLVVATGDAAATPSTDAFDCAGDNDDADLYLLPFPNGSTCTQALDTATGVGQEGVVAMDTGGDRVVLALPPSTVGGSGANVVSYVLDGELLEQDYQASVPGTVSTITVGESGARTAVAAASDGNTRVSVVNEQGVRTRTFQVPGPVRALEFSPSDRFLAVGGSFDQGNATFGYVQVHDLSMAAGANPVLDQEVRQAQSGQVASVSVTDHGQLAVGTFGGRVLFYPDATEGTDASPQEIVLGEDRAFVALAPNGTTMVVASGTNLSAHHDLPDETDATWTRALPRLADAVTLRAPYVYVETGEVLAYDLEGVPLWSLAGGGRFAANATGLGLAVATDATAGTGPGRTSVAGAVVHANLTLVQEGQGPTIAPGDIGMVNLTIQNRGAAIAQVTPVVEPPEGLTVDVLPDQLRIRPGENASLTLTVAVDSAAFPGQTQLPVRLMGQPPVNATLNASLTVGSATDLALALQPGAEAQRTLVQGQNTTFALVLENRGNSEAEANLELAQFPSRGQPWPATFEPSTFIKLAPQAKTTVLVDLRVPDDVANGTTNRIIVRAVTPDGAAAAQVRATVNPFEALSLEPQVATKKLAPGGNVSYTFQVTNRGSVPTNLTVEARAIDANGTAYVPAGWTVISSPNRLTLEAGQTEEVTVEVAAPEEGQRLRTQLVLQSEAGTRVSSLAFAVVDQSLTPDPPEEPKREPLGALAALVALAVATVVRRRGGWR